MAKNNVLRWTIRGLKLSSDAVIDVEVEPFHIIVRSSDKRFYKKLHVPSAERLGVPLVVAKVAHRFKADECLLAIVVRCGRIVQLVSVMWRVIE